MLKEFSYSTCINELFCICDALEYRRVKPQLDTSGTCISEQHQLLQSILRIWRPIQVYAVKNSSDLDLMSREEIEEIAEAETVLNITAWSSTVTQDEWHFTGAYRPLIINRVNYLLFGNTTKVINLDEVAGFTSVKKLVRVTRTFND